MLGKDPALRCVTTFMLPVLVLYGLYVQVHGDYSPGGGFQGGVIVASAVVLYSMLFKASIMRQAVPVTFVNALSATGLVIYVATGLASLVVGGNFLSYFFLVLNSVVEQKLGIFLVELGVGLTVCGSMVSIYFDFALQEK